MKSILLGVLCSLGVVGCNLPRRPAIIPGVVFAGPPFDGKMKSFNATFEPLATDAIPNDSYLTYDFAMASNDRGAIMVWIAECKTAGCGVDLEIVYKVYCDLDHKTCSVLDELGNLVLKGQPAPGGGVYAADGNDLLAASVAQKCSSDRYGLCTHFSLVDPRLIKPGTSERYISATFVADQIVDSSSVIPIH